MHQQSTWRLVRDDYFGGSALGGDSSKTFIQGDPATFTANIDTLRSAAPIGRYDG